MFFVFAETPVFYSVFSKNAKLKETQKKTLFVNTTVLIALVKMSVVSAFFIFAVFGISIFQKCFLIGFQKSNNNKIPKQEKQQKTATRKNAKQKKYYDSNKQDNKQKKTKTKEQLENKKTNNTNTKSKNQI